VITLKHELHGEINKQRHSDMQGPQASVY